MTDKQRNAITAFVSDITWKGCLTFVWNLIKISTPYYLLYLLLTGKL